VDKHITMQLAPHLFAVLSGLAGLGVAVMQDDRDSAQGFADMLSQPEVEPMAKEIIDLLQSISRDAFDGPQRTKIEIVN
jgi:hypothetical protein